MGIKDQFLSAKPRVKKIDIEGVGSCFVRSLSCAEINIINDMPEGDEASMKLFCLGLCDSDGNSIFDPQKDKEELSQLQIHIIIQVVKSINENSTTGAKIEAAKKN